MRTYMMIAKACCPGRTSALKVVARDETQAREKALLQLNGTSVFKWKSWKVERCNEVHTT